MKYVSSLDQRWRSILGDQIMPANPTKFFVGLG